MGNQQSNDRELTGRQPNDREMLVLLGLQKKLFTRLVESPVVRPSISLFIANIHDNAD